MHDQHSRAASTPSSFTRLCVALVLAISSSSPLFAQTTSRYARTDIEYGARLFNMHCIACHGENGDLLPQINLRSGPFPRSPSDRDLGENIKNGIPGTAMVATSYTDPEITALVAYVRNIGSVDLSSMQVGDAVRGRALFEGKGNCASCHRVFGRGPRAAPDLSTIGATRSAAQLERSLLGTEGGLIPINQPVRAVTRDGAVINGRRLNEDRYTVQLVDDRERLLSLDKSTLREYEVLATGVMPSYAQSLTDQERADVLAYLLTLKGLP
jgi:putative heme-binding domain-containing protein